jgi:glucose-1-phosphate cytidylyltransferase
MKTAILAGGRGTRLGAEASSVPKPLVPVAGQPVLRHVMDIYAAQGMTDFVVALGYRALDIKRHFLEAMTLEADMTIDYRTRSVTAAAGPMDGWTVKLVDTGQETATGGRVGRLVQHIDGERFMLTWCDGLADIDLAALLEFHRHHGKIATLTAVHRKARYGYLSLEGETVTRFDEKPMRDGDWINGAFFVLERGIFDYIDGDSCDWETNVLQRLVSDGQLMAFRHRGFWQSMDTPADRELLEQAIANGVMKHRGVRENT